MFHMLVPHPHHTHTAQAHFGGMTEWGQAGKNKNLAMAPVVVGYMPYAAVGRGRGGKGRGGKKGRGQ